MMPPKSRPCIETVLSTPGKFNGISRFCMGILGTNRPWQEKVPRLADIGTEISRHGACQLGPEEVCLPGHKSSSGRKNFDVKQTFQKPAKKSKSYPN